MSPRGAVLARLVGGLGLVAAAVVAVVAGSVAERRLEASTRAEAIPIPVTLLVPPSAPIAAEAGVFRTRAEALAISDYTMARRPANPRTLHSYRTRRAYPGAPPQIPHGLTGREFRAGNCTTCHERGGYSPRFGAYVPLTPHPDMGPCLQCHVGIDGVTGVALPSRDPNTICHQCHDPQTPRANPSAQWATTQWPPLWPKTANSPPPPIRHQLDLRSNCLACHAGPAAVEEIRTTHPDRTNCRQCHVATTDEVAPYTRAAPEAGLGGRR